MDNLSTEYFVDVRIRLINENQIISGMFGSWLINFGFYGFPKSHLPLYTGKIRFNFLVYILWIIDSLVRFLSTLKDNQTYMASSYHPNDFSY